MVDFKTAYNTILGRPTLSRFMAVVHYTYQCVKISGPKGIIRVAGNVRDGLRYDKKSLDIAEQFLGDETTTLQTPKDLSTPSKKPRRDDRGKCWHHILAPR